MALGSALVGAGASIIGNLFNKSANDSANRTNIKIAQLNNEWSEKMMQKQMDYNTAQWQREADYNTEMWNKTNEYNSASNQAKRLREAGLNPALVMSGQNAGTASAASSPSGNSVGLPSPSSATMMPNRYDFSGVGNAVNNAYQISAMLDRTSAEVNNLNAQADVARARAAADNALTYERLKETKVGRLFLEQTFDVRKNQLNADYQNSIRSGRQMEENIRLTAANALLASKELSIFDAQTQAALSNMIANTLLTNAQAKKTKSETIHEVQKMYKTMAERRGINISNDVARRSADAIVEKAIQDTLPMVGKYGSNRGDWLGRRKYGHYLY